MFTIHNSNAGTCGIVTCYGTASSSVQIALSDVIWIQGTSINVYIYNSSPAFSMGQITINFISFN